MIVKTQTSKGWQVFDNINSPVEYFRKIFEENQLKNTDPVLVVVGTKTGIQKFYEFHDNDPECPVDKSSSHNIMVVEFWDTLGNFVRIETTLQVFICNHDGKTIERVN